MPWKHFKRARYFLTVYNIQDVFNEDTKQLFNSASREFTFSGATFANIESVYANEQPPFVSNGTWAKFKFNALTMRFKETLKADE